VAIAAASSNGVCFSGFAWGVCFSGFAWGVCFSGFAWGVCFSGFASRVCFSGFAWGVLATVFGHLLEATGDRNKAALLSMNPLRKLLILLESKISSLRGAKRRGNLRLPLVEDVCVCKNAILARGYERSCVVPAPPEVGSWPHLLMQAYNKLAMPRFEVHGHTQGMHAYKKLAMTSLWTLHICPSRRGVTPMPRLSANKIKPRSRCSGPYS
jgi:hypothetical protein